MSKKTILTGIKPTGSPHIGNYIGAIRPGLEYAKNYDAFYFIADYHALTTNPSAEDFKEMSYEVAATWLALGLNPEKTVIYRQSDIPEIFELSWILSCYTPKGLMNRAHAYKACIAKNQEQNASDLDIGINMGLYNYPVLMAADILAFATNLVPVGGDQLQHIEITRDIAQRFNHHYGTEALTIPEPVTCEETATIPGLDGQKMSKSYNNTIPLFVPEKRLKKLIYKIKTDSSAPEDPKNPDDSLLFTIYKIFADGEQIDNMKTRYEKGIGWGEVKKELFELINETLKDPRDQYEKLMADRSQIDEILEKGASQAREVATSVLDGVRKAVGLS